MDSCIRQYNNDVDVTNSVSSLRLLYVVSEMHLSIGEDQDGVLVHELNPVSERGLQRLEMSQVCCYQKRDRHLDGKLCPEESSQIYRTQSEQDSSREKDRWIG